MQKTPTIFLSYCRANADVADSIDNDFKRIGVTFRRDIRDVAYLDDFTEYMNTIGKSDFVVTLVSDKFLKSEWCMYEMTQLLKTREFHKKFLPILLDDDISIKKIEGRLSYYEYWKNILDERNRSKTQEPKNKDLIKVIRRHKSIVDKLDDFFNYISTLNLLNVQTLKQQNYRPILDLVGFSDKIMTEKLLSIHKITNKQERSKALYHLEKEYPSNARIFFSKGINSEDDKEFLMAEIYYKEAINIDPEFAEACNNLGLIYQDQSKNSKLAREYYEKALSINKHDPITRFNLANLLKNAFNDFEGAAMNFQLAISLRPFFAEAHTNYANLLEKLGSYDGAYFHYQRAIFSDPGSANANFNLAFLLAEKLRNYKLAKVYYLEALRIDPNDPSFHYYLARLLTMLGELKESENHYTKATEIDASLISPKIDADFGIKR